MRKKHKNTAENTVIQSLIVGLNSFLVKKEAIELDDNNKQLLVVLKSLRLEFAKKHEEEMNRLILQYDDLQIVNGFETAVDLFKLSTETQLESDRHIIEWVKTGNDAAHIRSDILLQESIEYELSALTEYKLAQGTIKP